MEVYIGEIRMFAGNFAPKGFALCNGQILAISQNTALFSILGTTYGGNGQTTFALPNLQGRVPMHAGNGPGLSPRSLGETGGEETVTLITTQIPMHTHQLNAGSGQGDANTPENNYNGVYIDQNTGSGYNTYSTTANVKMNATAIGITGGSQPHDNMPPFQCINYIIALEGIYPSRN
jgi:microcystin-dependent protein